MFHDEECPPLLPISFTVPASQVNTRSRQRKGLITAVAGEEMS